jgi:hypothetical protein
MTVTITTHTGSKIAIHINTCLRTLRRSTFGYFAINQSIACLRYEHHEEAFLMFIKF